MLLVELVGKDLSFLAAVRAFADKRFQALEGFKSRAMLWCCHDYAPPFAITWGSFPGALSRMQQNSSTENHQKTIKI
jgi:hypothetical protein